MYTACPRCQTVFRASPGMLEKHHGLVRCGRCRCVFNARKHQVEPESLPVGPPAGTVHPAPSRPDPAPGERSGDGSAARGAESRPRTDALDSGRATVGPPPPRPAVAGGRRQEEAAAPLRPSPAAATEDAPPDADADGPPAAREQPAPGHGADVDGPPADGLPGPAAEQRSRWRRGGALPLGPLLLATEVLLSLGLVVLLATQLLWHFREALAWSGSPLAVPARDLATALGRPLPLPPPAGRAVVSHSSLEQASENPEALTLTATLRNTAGTTVAWPILEINLTDLDDRTVLRRLFRPEEYLPAPSRAGNGFPAGGEVNLRMHFLTRVLAMGYTLHLRDPEQG